jgi:predicted enzyme related to lactoylglutathione lyase
MVMCPNEVACVEARQNRHQFRFVVDDIERMIGIVALSGGESLDDLVRSEGSKSVGLRDPDGNTIELIQYL